VGVSKDCPIFSVPRIIPGTGKPIYELQILYAHSEDRSEQKTIKNFRKSNRGRTLGLSKIFRVHRAVIFAITQLSCFLRRLNHLCPENISTASEKNSRPTAHLTLPNTTN